jgi:cation transport regulator ChaC
MVGAVATEWVFGYGSLVGDSSGRIARLREHRRGWGVAMDNSVDVPGYKLYLAPDGSRPAVWVAFLDLFPASGSVNGLLRPVSDEQLVLLDQREHNYDRVDVTDLIDPALGRTWAYVGSAAGRRRRAQGARVGAVVIQRTYLEGVRAGFAALGPEELARFDASTDAPGMPLRDLRRVDLPAEPDS